MFSISLTRSAAALAITAGLFAAAAPASHGATQPRSNVVKSSTVLEDSMISGSVKAKAAKGKHGKGEGKDKPTHMYDIQSSNHV